MEIPEAVLKTIFKRLKKKGYVEYKSFEAMSITTAGKKEVSLLEGSVENVAREFNHLVSDLQSFYKSKGKPLSLSQVNVALLEFIDENIGLTSALISKKGEKPRLSDSIVAEYIFNIEKGDPALFAMLQNIFFGRLYLSLVKTRTEYTSDTKFEKLTIYLDTNVLFGLLGLHEEDSNKQAKELISAINNTSNINVAVFDITIEEARRVLSGYSQKNAIYVENIKVDSVYHRMNSRKIDKHKLALLLDKLEEEVSDLGVTIEATNIPNDSETKILASDIETWVGLLEHKPKLENALNHDAQILRLIQLKRIGVRTQLLEKSKAILVTSDSAIKEVTLALSKEKTTIPLSFTTIELVSYLWLREVGNTEIASSVVRQSVMAYAREKLITHNLWEKFVDALEEAQKDNKLTKDDIGIILTSDQTEKLLANENVRAIKKIINPKNIKKLRDEHEQIIESKANAESKISRIEAKVASFSNIIANIIVAIASIILLLIIGIVVYASITTIGLDHFASGIAVFSMFVIIGSALIFGRNIKASKIIIALRFKAIAIVDQKMNNWISRFIIGAEE